MKNNPILVISGALSPCFPICILFLFFLLPAFFFLPFTTLSMGSELSQFPGSIVVVMFPEARCRLELGAGIKGKRGIWDLPLWGSLRCTLFPCFYNY